MYRTCFSIDLESLRKSFQSKKEGNAYPELTNWFNQEALIRHCGEPMLPVPPKIFIIITSVLKLPICLILPLIFLLMMF